MTAIYSLHDLDGRQVNIQDYVKNYQIKFVYWDMGDTLVEFTEEMENRIIKKINGTFQRKIGLDLYRQAIADEWKRRETQLWERETKRVKDEETEKKYWVGFFTCVLNNLGIRGASCKKKISGLVKWLAKVQSNPKSFAPLFYTTEMIASFDSMRIRQGIISNAFPSAREILKQSGLIHHFNLQHIIFSYEYNTLKPEKAIYQKAIKKAGVPPSEILFIDDRKSFVEGALRNKIRAIQIKK